MPMRAASTTARLLREASAHYGRTRVDLAQAARHRDSTWRIPDDGTIAAATRRLEQWGFLRVTVASRGGRQENVVYRITSAGATECQRLFGTVPS